MNFIGTANVAGIERHGNSVHQETQTMQKALHVRTIVQPGGKIEIVDRTLPIGESVDVVVSQSPEPSGRSAVDILAEAPGHVLFKTAEDVAAYLKEERNSWWPRIKKRDP